MPKHTFDAKAESKEFKPLPDGDYPFEVMAIDIGLRNSGKTSGSEFIGMKLAFFKDATFSEKLAQFTEDLIFHPSIAWKIDTFTKSANMLIDGRQPLDQEEIDYSEKTMVGLRGWATVRSKPGQNDPSKMFNEVKVWLTNKPKLARNTPAPAAPGTGDDNLPF